MPGYSSRILDIAKGALSVQQALIGITSQNIANANTPGYAKRVGNVETKSIGDSAGGISIGAGVNLASISRIVDEYKEATVRSSIAEKQGADVKNDYLERIQNLFPLDGSAGSIGGAMTEFFGALNDLTVNPSSLEARSTVLNKADGLVSSIRNAYSTISGAQREIDDRLSIEINNVNSLTTQIAQYNFKIAQIEGGTGNVAADERDKRALLEEKLSEKISFKRLELPDGQVNLTLANGFSLVSGSNTHQLGVDRAPSFITGAQAPGLDGSNLSYIVYDYGNASASAEIDLTSIIGNGDGLLSGLLAVRGIQQTTDTSSFDAVGFLPELGSRIEGLTRSLLTDFNLEYLGPDEDSGTAGLQPSSADLNGNTPSVYGFFDFNYSGTKDANGDGRPNDLAALGIDNFSSLLQVKPTTPQEIAAARDQDATAGSTSFVTGDGSNIEALVALQDQNFTYSVGSYSQSSTWGQLYDQTVTFVGNEKAKAQTNKSLADDKNVLSLNQRDSVSGVALDEEFTNLIKFQQQFQAAAKIIKSVSEMLDIVSNL